MFFPELLSVLPGWQEPFASHDAGDLGTAQEKTSRITRTVKFRNADEKARWLDGAAKFDAWHLPKLRALAARFATAPSHDPNDPDALAIDFYGFTRDGVHYVSDPGGMEQMSDSDVILENGAGDCDDKARLFVALCSCVRIPARIRPCFTDPAVGENFVHVQAEVYMQKFGEWVPVEFIVRDLPFGAMPPHGKKILQ